SGLLLQGQRYPLRDLEPVAGEPEQPAGVVGEPADLADADVAQDLRPDPEVLEDAEPVPEIRARRRTPVAALRGREQVESPGIPADVEDDAASLSGDPLHRSVEEA